MKVPNYHSICISEADTEKVYKCVEKYYVVNPMFTRILTSPQGNVRPEFKALEEFLGEGNSEINPYEVPLLHQMQEESEIDPYYAMSETQNTHKNL